MPDQIVWFDLPVIDLKRAMHFYSEVLNTEIIEKFPDVAVTSHEDNEVSGCLFKSDKEVPSKTGVLIYLNVHERLEAAVDAVERNGGQIEKPPHKIAPFGHRAVVIDSEGNRIALHSG